MLICYENQSNMKLKCFQNCSTKSDLFSANSIVLPRISHGYNYVLFILIPFNELSVCVNNEGRYISFSTMTMAMITIMTHTTFRFYLDTDFPSQFCVFYRKIT